MEIENKIQFLDGAMGTQLQDKGLPAGASPELFMMEHGEIIEDVHAAYIDSGSDIIYTNTFGANAKKLCKSQYTVEEVITRAVQLAKSAAKRRNGVQVALDIGPIGELLEPNGYLPFEEAYELYRQQVVAGEQAGADLVIFETMSDLYEVKAAILAAKEHTQLPVFVTMSFEADHRTFTGCTTASFALCAEGLGADAIGINCSLGPDQILPIAEELAAMTNLPLIIKADVQGSVEAVKQSLTRLSNEEVVVKVIHGGVGAINESDVTLASASNAIIIGFNVRPDATAKSIAEREKVDLRLYRVIYQAIEDVEAAMKGMLDPVFEEKVIGHAEIRQLFKASGVGTIAGSYVLDGKFQRGCSCRITREGEQIYEGPLASLKRFKDDVKEVAAGYECGLVFEKFNDLKEDDVIEAYTMVEVPR